MHHQCTLSEWNCREGYWRCPKHCKPLLHTVNHWPNVRNFALQPYAMSYAVYLDNWLPSQKDGRLLVEVFGSWQVRHHLNDCHTFDCPVYACQNALEAGNVIPKLKLSTCLGVNIVPLTLLRKKCLHGPQSNHRACLSTIPWFLWWHLWNCADSWYIHGKC